ncbi:MAG: ketoacyl-ACP synthase III [Emcibacteraceae bacterium]|nr:ketoacyl-ACP synthase III [Emcibacteraceae bacterium]
MAMSKFKSAKIGGMVTVVPNKIRTFDEDAKEFDIEPKQLTKIKKTIGLDRRHVVEDGMTTLDLCMAAAEDLILGLNLDKGDIDGLIFVTQTPDHFQPCNAAIVHGRLGLSTDCASFDVNLGCSGFVYGLWLAHMMIETNSCTNIIVLAGDTISRCVNSKDKSVRPLFGDGGTATLVERTKTDNPTYFSMHTDGKGSNHIKHPAGAFRLPSSIETAKEFTTEDGNIMCDDNLQMDGLEVFLFSVRIEPKAIKQILEFSNVDIEDVDHLIFHQANKYIIGEIVKRLKISKTKAPATTVEKYGNQSSASIPSTINDVLGEEITKNSKKVILSGFGVGLSWATCLTEIKMQYCPPVKILK